jgi:hypothetical protein
MKLLSGLFILGVARDGATFTTVSETDSGSSAAANTKKLRLARERKIKERKFGSLLPPWRTDRARLPPILRRYLNIIL